MNKPVAWMARNQLNNKYVPISCEEKERNSYYVMQIYDDWQPLYTHPVKELNDGGEPVKNATYWKKQHDNLLMKLNTYAIKVSELEKELDTANKAYMWMDETYKGVLAELESLKSHPAKELTLSREDVRKVWLALPYDPDNAPYIFADAILRKAQEK